MPTQAELFWNDALHRYLDLPHGARPGSYADLELRHWEERMILEPPPGKSKGLTTDQRLETPRFMRMEDAGVRLIPESDWPDIIAQQKAAGASPKNYVWDILDQDGDGSCAAESKDGSIMCVREMSNQERVLFNPLGTYHTTGGGRDNGSSLQDNIRFAQDFGCFPESVWPRSKGYKTKPSDEAYDAAKAYRLRESVQITDRISMCSWLLQGLPVYYSYDGHAIFAVEAIDSSRFWYANSWDESWGDHGFGTMSYSSVLWDSVYAILAETWAGPQEVL
jgi:hypothetical protein